MTDEIIDPLADVPPSLPASNPEGIHVQPIVNPVQTGEIDPFAPPPSPGQTTA